jgi:Tol biopolymer transport system component
VDIPSESGNSVPELSPDGKKLYFWQGAVLRGTPGSRFLERDLISGEERTLWSGREGPIYPSLSPDGRSFAGIVRSEDSKSSALVVIPLTGGEPRQLLRVNDARTLSNYVTWSRDGSCVIVPARAGAAYEPMVVPISGDEPRRLNLEIGQLGVKLHPDNRQLAFSAGAQSAEVWVLENFLPAQAPKR